MSEKLLPCPFCNGPADYTGREGQGYRVVCKHCDARGGWGDYGYQAEAAWNRRTPQGMETRQGGDSLSGSVACDDSPVGHQADAPETVGLTFSRGVDEVREALAQCAVWLDGFDSTLGDYARAALHGDQEG
ncbi:MAG TPA: Lar family restriction alleviation protein [Sphingobium sp.]|nr:Lar family restriction alleviation protein [Sphingobium sp.]